MLNRISYAFVFLLCSASIIYLCSGVFFGEFRTDEAYFMQSSWNMLHGIGSSIEVYMPGGYPYLLSKGLQFFDYDIEYFLFVRYLNLGIALFLLHYFSTLMLRLFDETKFKHILVGFIVSVSLVLYLASMRAFEIRPESLGGLFIAFGSYYMMFFEDKTDSRKISFYASITFLIIATFFSVRYLVPLCFIWLATLLLYVSREENRYIEILKAVVFSVCLSAFVFFIFHYISDIGLALDRAQAINSNRIGADLYEKMVLLGFGKVYYLNDFPFVEYFRIAFSSFFYFISIVLLIFEKNFLQRLIVIVLIFSNISLFIVLIFFDFKPYDYAVVHEAIITFFSCMYVLKRLKEYSRITTVALFYFVMTFIYLIVPSNRVIEKNQKKLDGVTYSSFDLDESLVSTMNLAQVSAARSATNIQSSARYQINTMKRFCELNFNEGVYVFSKRYDNHPICMKDIYTYQYYVTNRLYSSIVDEIRLGGSILFSDDNYLIYMKN